MIETLKFYVNQLSAKRAEIYSKSWWTVGYIIYKQTRGSEEGYKLWLEFSQQDVDKYTYSICNKKWLSFKKVCYSISIKILVSFVNEDGGSIYDPNHNHFVEDNEVRNFVYSIIVSKLSIRRMRNIDALNNLCSAIYHMSSGEDKDAMLEVCKRIKDDQLKRIFVMSWNQKKFAHCCHINDIIYWHNSDEKEKPHPRATNIKKYISNDPLWLEQTIHYLELFDNAGYTPRYFKVSVEEREKLKQAVRKRKKKHLLQDLPYKKMSF